MVLILDQEIFLSILLRDKKHYENNSRRRGGSLWIRTEGIYAAMVWKRLKNVYYLQSCWHSLMRTIARNCKPFYREQAGFEGGEDSSGIELCSVFSHRIKVKRHKFLRSAG